MQFVFSRAFARSILFASFILVLAAKMAHAWLPPEGKTSPARFSAGEIARAAEIADGTRWVWSSAVGGAR